jgi:hypothetical protein
MLKKRQGDNETKYWEEGRYVWTGKGFWASCGKLDGMRRNLEEQEWREQRMEARRREWEHLQKGKGPLPPGARPIPPPPDESYVRAFFSTLEL